MALASRIAAAPADEIRAMAIFDRTWSTDELPHRAAGARPVGRPDRGLEPVADAEPTPAPAAATTQEAARAMMWGLEAGGWNEREAGNLVGLAHGLRPARAGWTEREIEHLRFLRAIVESGRLDH